MADYSSEELSSDEELQVEFSKGNLTAGLIERAAPPKICTNNVAGLREKLAHLQKRDLEWLERMDITSHSVSGHASSSKDEEDESSLDPEDDFKREMHFYQQALSSVQIGLRKLEELGVPIKRPEDYFAEMLKNDDHMRKVRQNLLSRQKVLAKKEQFRKLREQQKFGKKIQQDVLQKRKAEKKASLEAIKRFRKGRGDKPSFLERADDDDGFPVAVSSGGVTGSAKQQKKDKSKKRQIKDQKFGYGGKKRWLKSNTAESSADMSSFSSTRHSKMSTGKKGDIFGIEGKRAKKGKPGRLGKSRRQKSKLKR